MGKTREEEEKEEEEEEEDEEEEQEEREGIETKTFLLWAEICYGPSSLHLKHDLDWWSNRRMKKHRSNWRSNRPEKCQGF